MKGFNHHYEDGQHRHRLHRKMSYARHGEDMEFLRFRHGGERGGYGRRGEGKRFFERGQFKFALLELLAEQAMHGYQLMKAMEEKTGGLYVPSAGSIYPNLQLLEDMGYISSSDADGKKLYQITEAGKNHLEERSQQATREEERWKHHHRERSGMQQFGRNPKQQLKSFMQDWSELVYLMAQASQAVQQAPDSEQAEQFKKLMETTQAGMQQIVAALAAAPQAENDQEGQ